ncbi:MAG: hypothetical protein IBX64_04555 [Actinobacteria bacterium]|nr:hypothetical protein [Actinomycetota bacterium]
MKRKVLYAIILLAFTMTIGIAIYNRINWGHIVPFFEPDRIDPRRHMVCIEGSTLREYDDIYGIDIGEINGKPQINSAVFNTRLYVFKALFDSRVEAWSIKGPRHPYD